MTLTERETFVDTSGLVARAANHWVTHKLGGLGPAIASERLVKEPLQTVWDDRVLGRAFRIFGGVPLVELREANDRVGAGVKRTLKGAVAFPPSSPSCPPRATSGIRPAAPNS